MKKIVLLFEKGGEKKQVQRRLILCNLKEAYCAFKDAHLEVEIGFSKYALLRPKHCVHAGASGTHLVCVCCVHQNFELMVEAVHLNRLTRDPTVSIQNYKDVLNFVMCQPAREKCHLRLCVFCSKIAKVAELLENNFEQDAIDQDAIEYKQWMTTDRCNLKTVTASAEELIAEFVDQIPALLRHSFIASQQSNFLKDKKTKLQNDEAFVICDFS